MQQHKSAGLLNVSQRELIDLIKPGQNKDGLTQAILFLLSLVLTPITIWGSLLGYIRGHQRFMQNEAPRLHNLKPIVKLAMILGAVAIWIAVYLVAKVMAKAGLWLLGDSMRYHPMLLTSFLLINVILSICVFVWFSKWRKRMTKFIDEKRRHGSARFATEQELKPYRHGQGTYVGKDLHYNKPSHILTVAGTRGGKLANLLSYNLLKAAPLTGNKVILDLKGELAAISARLQKKNRKVVVINPWNLLSLSNEKYNPLELLGDADSPNVVDDVSMVVESIVPINKDSKDEHWDEKSRSILTGLLLHMVTEYQSADRTLEKIWSWLRLPNDEWISLIADMAVNDNEHVGEIIRATANEIANLIKNSDREYGSVMSTVQRHTDFIKSPALRHSMSSGHDFKLEDLKSHSVTIYVVIPFDRISTQNKWLRLVITSLMRHAVRNSYKTQFILDEAYALGHHSEIQTGIGAYAGMGISIWSIFQNLGQIEEIYGKNWEGFVANCAVRHYFNLSDNSSCEYVSKMFGKTSIPQYDEKGEITGATERDLVTPDELRRESGINIYTVIDQLPPAAIPKAPYYLTDIDCDPNPYIITEPLEYNANAERQAALMEALQRVDDNIEG